MRLIERVHAREHGLAREYPLVFDPAFDGRVLALEENGHVRSACALLVRDFLGGKTRTRVGMIGSVSTDPDWRGCGWGAERTCKGWCTSGPDPRTTCWRCCARSTSALGLAARLGPWR
jgi:hypothetical protein